MRSPSPHPISTTASDGKTPETLRWRRKAGENVGPGSVTQTSASHRQASHRVTRRHTDARGQTTPAGKSSSTSEEEKPALYVPVTQTKGDHTDRAPTHTESMPHRLHSGLSHKLRRSHRSHSNELPHKLHSGLSHRLRGSHRSHSKELPHRLHSVLSHRLTHASESMPHRLHSVWSHRLP